MHLKPSDLAGDAAAQRDALLQLATRAGRRLVTVRGDVLLSALEGAPPAAASRKRTPRNAAKTTESK